MVWYARSWGVALTVSVVAMASARPEANSFLAHAAPTVQSLVRQVQSDSSVRSRYERHFGMSSHQVISYLGSLHRSRLATKALYEVYSALPDESLKMHMQTLPKGEVVFVDRDGKPILRAKCGNPITLGRQYSSKKSVPPVSSEVLKVHETTNNLLVADLTPDVPLEPGLPEIVEVTDGSGAAVPFATPVAPVVPGVISSAGSSGLAQGLAGLVAIAGTSVKWSSGGHEVVPEPAMYLLAGPALLVVLRRRKSKASRRGTRVG